MDKTPPSKTRLTGQDEQTQRTAKDHEIPVPRRSDFMRDLGKIAKGGKPTLAVSSLGS
jgi:hypothetical protein